MGLNERQHSVTDLLTGSPDEVIVGKCEHRCLFEGCESIFGSAARLRKHEMIHAERAIFTCDRDDCTKSFRLKANLERHKKTPHTKVQKPKKTYICSFCEKSCKSKFDLRLHEAVHTGNKPLKCDICDAAFAKTSRLNQHLKTHHTYSCAFPGCHFEADKWSLLRKHLPVHNLKCPHCSSKFKTQQSLDKHVASHTLTLKCDQCDLQYANRSSLRSHVRSVHEKVTFTCAVERCGKEFAFRKSLRHHMKTHTDPLAVAKKTGATIKRVVAAVTLSGYEASEEEKQILLAQDKDFRILQANESKIDRDESIKS